MKFFGTTIFGVLTLLAGLFWWWLCLHLFSDLLHEKGNMANVIASMFAFPVMGVFFLIIVGPFATLFMVSLIRAMRS